jgi:hypothetical protein
MSDKLRTSLNMDVKLEEGLLIEAKCYEACEERKVDPDTGEEGGLLRPCLNPCGRFVFDFAWIAVAGLMFWIAVFLSFSGTAEYLIAFVWVFGLWAFSFRIGFFFDKYVNIGMRQAETWCFCRRTGRMDPCCACCCRGCCGACQTTPMYGLPGCEFCDKAGGDGPSGLMRKDRVFMSAFEHFDADNSNSMSCEELAPLLKRVRRPCLTSLLPVYFSLSTSPSLLLLLLLQHNDNTSFSFSYRQISFFFSFSVCRPN